MKVYVDEMPKCNKCKFHTIEESELNKFPILIHRCKISGNTITEYCPLHTTKELEQEVRKQVCDEIRERVCDVCDYDNECFNTGIVFDSDILRHILNQIEKGSDSDEN